jgi:cardiolipin synthase
MAVLSLERKSFKNTNVELIKASNKFIRMFKELENAESYIHMEYFKFKSGEILNDLYKVLSKKVKEGVEVKIIIDDIGSINLNRNVIKKFNDAGIEMVAFNKIIALFFSGYLNFRIHRKLIVIDGKKAFLGGMNIGDEYAGLTTKYGD